MRKSHVIIAILVVIIAVALFVWFTKTKQSPKKDKFQDMKPRSCPPFKVWDGKKCICDYPNGIVWDSVKKECVCDKQKGFAWDGLKCVRPMDIQCPGDEYFDWTTNMCKKP
ncbi:hypothetical protein ATCVMN08101_609L [Acanthocystis turfacea Chlorella virus MN0810.1]|nr:hypothetical protein ATCVMN08101_609L [Acanthocystis turfacea Chlorella virus MN0810.1]